MRGGEDEGMWGSMAGGGVGDGEEGGGIHHHRPNPPPPKPSRNPTPPHPPPRSESFLRVVRREWQSDSGLVHREHHRLALA